MNQTVKYIFGLMVSPKKTFNLLANDSKNMIYSWIALVSLTIAFIISNGSFFLLQIKSPIPPLVNIPIEYAYLFSLAAGIPAQVFLFMMVAATIYMMSKLFKGSSTFENTFSMVSFGLFVPFFLYWLFEIGFLLYMVINGKKESGMISVILVIVFMAITVIWQTVLLTIGTSVTQKIKGIPAFIVTLVSILVFWGIDALFFG